VNAITNASVGEALDEDELEAELEGMEQERIDEQMLNTGTIPVATRLDGLPSAANGERKFTLLEFFLQPTTQLP
jgi:charged multivesicular body protein 4A/B